MANFVQFKGEDDNMGGWTGGSIICMPKQWFRCFEARIRGSW